MSTRIWLPRVFIIPGMFVRHLLVIFLGCLLSCLSANNARSDDPPQKTPLGEQHAVDLLDGFFGTGQDETESPKTEVDASSPEGNSDKSSTQTAISPDRKEKDKPKPPPRRRSGNRLEAVHDFEAGRQLALLEQRPLLVLFGAQWCHWCRMLEEELATAEAEGILQRWVVAFVDVDSETLVSEQFQVGSLPSMRILDGSGAVIASRSGYQPLVELEVWLDDHHQQADPVLQTVLFAAGSPNSDEIKQLTELLSWRSASVRSAAAKRLSDHRGLTAAAVVDKLRVGNLASQLTAMEILATWSAPTAGIDPWVPESINAETTTPLVEWLRTLPASSGPLELDTNALEAETRNVGELLRELIASPPSRHGELIQRAIAMGDAAATESKRIESNVESLSDRQKVLLRQVRYSVFAGPTTRLTNAGLIQSLSELDGPTHRAAAEKLLSDTTSQDEPLIDELSIDPDPMVREMAVAALHQIGALASGERIRNLLSDESPSVRTAVLKQLSEDPDDEITKRLVEYLLTESDEDLLIYATKILGKLASSPDANDALVKLIGDNRWRIRAAALDAVSDFVSENRYSFFSSENDSVVSEPIADAVLDHTSDADAFVAQKAQYLLPKVVSKRTAPAVAKFLLSDLVRGREIIASVEEYERGRLMAPLIELSEEWLDEDDPQNHARAALLMTEVSPTILRYRLDDLLQSDSQEVRLAALRAFLPCMEEFRTKSFSEDLEKWRLAFSKTEARAIASIDLMGTIPERFQRTSNTVIASEKEPVADDMVAAQKETTSGSDPLDQFGSFFGPSRSKEDAETEDTEPVMEAETKSEERSPLDLTASLFGSVPDNPSEPIESGSNEDPNEQSTVDPRRLGQTSYWLMRWQEGDESITIPTWIRRCEPIIRQLAKPEATDASHETERLWANAALLACGDTGVAESVLAATDQASDSDPSIEQVIAWLPAENRLNWVQDHLDDLSSGMWTDSMEKTWEAATLVESKEVAVAFDESLQISDEPSKQTMRRFVHFLERSLTGGLEEHHSTHLDEDELVADDAGLLAKRKTNEIHTGQAEAARWLIDHYTSAKSAQHRAVLLAVLARISRRHATAEALALFEQRPLDGVLLDTAIILALNDQLSLSADRAAALLNHPNPTVVDAALRCLSSESALEEMQTENIGVPTVYRSDSLHPLQLIVRPLSEDTLSQLSHRENKTSAAIADTLLVSMGKKLPLDSLQSRLGGIERPLTLLTVALAKAERTDEDAIEIYRRCAQAVEWQDEEAVRIALQSLRDDRIKKIIQTHMQDSDNMYSF